MTTLGVLRTDSISTWPSAAAAISTTSGVGAWVYGAWVQVNAASTTTVPHLILGAFYRGSAGFEVDVQIGIGGAGSETVVGLVPAVGLFLAPPVGSFPVWPAAARLAIRSRDNAGSATQDFWIVTCPLPSANAQ